MSYSQATMPSNASALSEPIQLIGHVTGDNTDSASWHHKITPNGYALIIILGSVTALWLLGGAFSSVRA
jgi:hypothetical protein